MNQSSRWMYVMFAFCAAAVLGALAFVTSHVLRLERLDIESRAAAKTDETIRLALWRMDSAVNAIIAREAARPYFEYQPFYAADRAYTRMFDDVRPGEVLVPSPLLLGSGEYVTLHFQRTPEGTITSPQVPTGNMRDLAESAYVDGTAVIAAEDHLRHLALLLSPPDRSAGRGLAAGATAREPSAAKLISPPDSERERTEGATAEQFGRAKDERAPEQSKREYEARSQSAEWAASNVMQQRATPSPRVPGRPAVSENASTSVTLAPGVAETDATRTTIPDKALDTLALRDRRDMDRDASRPYKLDSLKEPETQLPDGKLSASDPKEEAKGAGAPMDDAAQDQSRKQPPPTSLSARPAPAAEPAAIAGSPVAHVFPVPPAPQSKVEAPGVRSVTGATLTESPGSGPSYRSATLSRATSNFPPIFGLAYEPEPAVSLSPFVPTWLGESPRELIFTRNIATASATLEQGLWFDWPRLAEFLQTSAKDLVPGALLIPTSHAPSPDPGTLARRLASVPAEIRWTPPHTPATHSWTPARTTLTLTWIATLIAIAAIAFVLHSSTDLAERRGRFVSAVTHELRTPLTTFCMYSQMLADGMVTSDDARREYLQTLKHEASRLSRIVENVLDYARLGRKKKTVSPDPIRATDLFARVESVLRLRREQSGVQLLIHSPGPSDGAIRVDPATVERILYNLVDNACKYACSMSPRPATGSTFNMHQNDVGPPSSSDACAPTIDISLSITADDVTFSVRDHGPGIPASERSHIFKPFHRGVHHSDGSIPGLGLGLALARGLAHSLAGSLELRATTTGTQVDLVIPRSAEVRAL